MGFPNAFISTLSSLGLQAVVFLGKAWPFQQSLASSSECDSTELEEFQSAQRVSKTRQVTITG